LRSLLANGHKQAPTLIEIYYLESMLLAADSYSIFYGTDRQIEDRDPNSHVTRWAIWDGTDVHQVMANGQPTIE
jgi:hypothetical protein